VTAQATSLGVSPITMNCSAEDRAEMFIDSLRGQRRQVPAVERIVTERAGKRKNGARPVISTSGALLVLCCR